MENDYWSQRQQERWQRRQARWARRQERWARRGPAHGFAFGSIVIAVGILFLLNNLGLVRIRDFFAYWPVILIAFGIIRLVDSHGRASLIWGGILTSVGTLLLLDNLDIIYFDRRIIWPVLLIAWGVLMLVLPRRWHGPVPPGVQPPDDGPGTAQFNSSAATLNLWVVFGGGKRRIDSQEFRGGEISATFGGFEIDLRGAAMAEEQATIDVTAMFGGVEIKVPETWTVETRVAGIFGGFDDETRPPRADQVTRPQRLIITGYTMFGGGSVKN